MVWLGCAAIVGGVLAVFGLVPRLEQMRSLRQGGHDLHFHIADSLPLNRQHWKLVIVLVVAFAVDVLKPASLGFVMPGMTREDGITKETAGILALVALTGTTVGSISAAVLEPLFSWRALWLLGLPTGLLIVFLRLEDIQEAMSGKTPGRLRSARL